MIVLLITRLLDMFTTYLNINKWGYGVEGNPLIRELMERGLFIPGQFFMIGLITVLAEALPKYKRIIYVSISSLSLVAVAINTYCFIFIK